MFWRWASFHSRGIPKVVNPVHRVLPLFDNWSLVRGSRVISVQHVERVNLTGLGGKLFSTGLDEVFVRIVPVHPLTQWQGRVPQVPTRRR
jgi:hypothetical protein